MHKWQCGSCVGIKSLVLGILILINGIWNIIANWYVFFGLLFVVWGAVSLFSHGSCTCEPRMMESMPVKKKRK